jgi:phage terminase small subunit
MARRWRELELLASTIYATLRSSGLTNEEGEGRRLLDDYRKMVQTQVVLARELGLTPSARMALKASSTHSALDLAAVMAQSGDDQDPAQDDAEPSTTVTEPSHD